MAQKKTTTKTKKLHPGGSIPGRGAGMQMAVPGGTKGFRRRKTAPARRRNRINQLASMQRRRRRRNTTMPTAGMSQGRPAVGRTPMPGPAPDSARLRRMQQLMRQQRKRQSGRPVGQPIGLAGRLASRRRPVRSRRR